MQHILIVDDEESIVQMFKRYFEHCGFRVSATLDADEAVRIAQDESVAGVITDYRMPKMNGDELLNRIRERRPELPAIIVSAYTGKILPELHHRTRIFSKPAQMDKLMNCMKQLIGEKG